MTEDSLDVYFRSLIVEAIGLGSREIRVSRDNERTRIEMNVEGQYIEYPHRPKKHYGDLVERLQKSTGLAAADSGKTAKASITRKGSAIPLLVTSLSGDSLQIDIQPS